MLTLCLSTERNGFSPVPLSLAEWLTFKSAYTSAAISEEGLMSLGKTELQEKLALPKALSDRIFGLLRRDFALSFSLEDYKTKGIALITYEHPLFPRALKTKLGLDCPPILCATGDFALLERECVGMLSSRLVSEEDKAFASLTAEKILQQNKVLNLGGVSGIMGMLREKAIQCKGKVVVFMATPLSQPNPHNALPTCPEGGLLVSLPAYSKGSFEYRAILRNLCVLAFSKATVVVKAEDQRGSTFMAVHKTLQQKMSPVLCHAVKRHAGNTKLIQAGAVSIATNTPLIF